MPKTFQFTSPEGKSYEITGPDDATQEQAFGILQKQMGGEAPKPPMSLMPGTPNSGAAGRFAGGVAKSLNPFPAIKTLADIATDPKQGAEKALKAALYDPAVDQFKKAGKSFRGEGDAAGMGRAGRVVSGISHGAAGLLPLAGPAAANIGDTIGDGDIAGGLGELTGIALTESLPRVSRYVGGKLQRGAEPIAESALGIGNKQRRYNATPGRAALDETTGLKPGTVAESARAKNKQLNTELESAAGRSTQTATLRNALDVIRQRARTAAAGNSSATPRELAAMADQLTVPQPGFAGVIDPATGMIAVDQSPMNILRMKREFGKDFTTWNPLHPKGEMGTARKVYRELDKELDRTVPGADKLNQRIQSLTHVAEAAENKALNNGIAGNALNRIARPTGALVGAAAGTAAGGPLGGLLGLVGPEVVTNPAVKMAVARTMNAAGKVARSPYFTTPAQVAAAVNALRNNGDPLDLARFLQ